LAADVERNKLTAYAVFMGTHLVSVLIFWSHWNQLCFKGSGLI
jgi:hypothetical protein